MLLLFDLMLAGSKYCCAGTSTKLLIILNIMVSWAFVLLDSINSNKDVCNAASIVIAVCNKPSSSLLHHLQLMGLIFLIWISDCGAIL